MSSPPNTAGAGSPFRNVWMLLGLITGVAVAVVGSLWALTDPQKDELSYEVAKTCLQVIGVAVIGGVITAATSSAQQAAQDRGAAEADRRKADAESLERQREGFEVRASLLDRATRCAQKMFVTCQHVRRVKADATADAEGTSPTAEAQALLDRTYLEFSTEAEAIQTEIGARFGEKWREDAGSAEAFLRWHQVTDLLTVYYFTLSGRFRGNVLARNSVGDDGRMHSGVDFTLMVESPDNPTTQEMKNVRSAVRAEFWSAMPEFARAVLTDDLRDL